MSKKKIVMMDIKPDSYKLSMVSKPHDALLPVVCLSDSDEKATCSEDVLKEINKFCDGKWHPLKSHTVKNTIEEL
jgi:hypothetical protein